MTRLPRLFALAAVLVLGACTSDQIGGPTDLSRPAVFSPPVGAVAALVEFLPAGSYDSVRVTANGNSLYSRMSAGGNRLLLVGRSSDTTVTPVALVRQIGLTAYPRAGVDRSTLSAHVVSLTDSAGAVLPVIGSTVSFTAP